MAVDGYEIANGLLLDPAFRARYRDSEELVEAAIAEGIRLAPRDGDKDEVAAASRFMARKDAHGRLARFRAGVPDDPDLERRIEGHAAMLGSSRKEVEDVKKMMGLLRP